MKDVRKVIAEKIWETIDHFQDEGEEPDYVSYIMFIITGSILYNMYGASKFNEMVKEIKMLVKEGKRKL